MSAIKRLFDFCYDRDSDFREAIDNDDYDAANEIMINDFNKYHDEILNEINSN